MGLDLYDLAVEIIGPVPIILEPIYWVATFFLFLLVIKILLYILNLSGMFFKGGR